MLIPLIKDKTSCDYHRLTLPLTTMGMDVSYYLHKPIGEIINQDTHAVIFNRWPGFDIIHLLRLKKKYNFKIICDLDDFWELYPNHVLYETWKRENMSQKIFESIFNSDLVTVTNSKLAEFVSKYNKNVEVVPNGLPYDTGQFAPNYTKSDLARVIYAGGTSHFWDLHSIRNLFYKVGRESLKNYCEFVLAGYQDNDVLKGMARIMSGNGVVNQRNKEGLPITSYMSLYDDADIAIAPLESKVFNAFKSNLKVLEAGAKNLPIIASRVAPYSNENLPGQFLCDGVYEWYSVLKRLVESPVYRHEQGLKLGEAVREKYNLFKINELRKQLYEL